MKWSQLKIRVEELFADSVRERVELHTTRYRKSHDHLGRGWITIDGEEIANMCDYVSGIARWKTARELLAAGSCNNGENGDHIDGYLRADKKAVQIIHAQGLFSRYEFCRALHEYLNLSIDQILVAPNPIIRAIGMLDRRIGKRRLIQIDTRSELPLVRRLHQFRLEAEEIQATTGV